MDVITAFIHGEVKENIYIEGPDGVVGGDRKSIVFSF